jgi:hypothetical protein
LHNNKTKTKTRNQQLVKFEPTSFSGSGVCNSTRDHE